MTDGLSPLEPVLRRNRRRRAGRHPVLSVIIPVFNEQDAIPSCIRRLQETVTGEDAEFLFINDGSRDGSLAVLLAEGDSEPRIRIVNFSRNFGKEAAMTAGLELCRGEVIVPMDADLQDPPELIGIFLDRWREGYDVVYGVRESRDGDGPVKRFTAQLFYRLFNLVSPLKIPVNAGDFRLIDRRVADILRKIPERNRFMKGLFSWVGFPAVAVPYTRPGRLSGHSSWNMWRLWNFALDGLMGFSSIPLRVWSYLGAVISLCAFFYALYVVLTVLFAGATTPGYASMISAILFLGGIQLVSLGIIGEYVGRLLVETKMRPLYLVEGIYQGGQARAPEPQGEGAHREGRHPEEGQG